MQVRDRPVAHASRWLILLLAVVAAAGLGVGRAPQAGAAPRLTLQAGGPYYGSPVPGDLVQFTATVGGPLPIGGYHIHWHFGDGGAANGAIVTHHYAGPGHFVATAEADTNIGNNLADTDNADVYISALDAAGPYNDTVGHLVPFHALVQSPPPMPWTVHWIYGDGATGDQVDGGFGPHPYAAAGNYTATAQLMKGGDIIMQDTAAVTITGGTTIEAGGPYSGAVGVQINFAASVNNGPPGYSVVWDFGDGTQATGGIVQHAYGAPGVYPVTATVYQGAIAVVSDAASAVIAGAATTIEAGGPYNGSAGQQIAFTAIVNSPPPGYTVTWTFGDGTSAQGDSATHTYAAAGTYSVTATVYQGALAVASDSSTATVTAAVQPAAVEADGPYTGMVGQAVSFAATVSNPPAGYSVAWDFGDGGSGSGASTSHVYSAAGSYTAIVTIYQGATPIVSDSTIVTITAAPPSGPTVTYQAGWNIVAGPAGMAFPQASGPLYTYQDGDTNYEVLASTSGVTSGYGYWAYFPVPTTVTLSGAGAPSATIPAPAGHWVMVGNPSPLASVQVQGADLVVDYDLATNSYVAVSTLAPGQGAWAISVNGGTITLAP